MPVTVQLVIKLTKLRHLTHAQAAAHLGLTEAEILDTCRMGLVTMAHEPESPQDGPDDADRAAARANWAMKWQQRYEKGKR